MIGVFSLILSAYFGGNLQSYPRENGFLPFLSINLFLGVLAYEAQIVLVNLNLQGRPHYP
jgi:hypothetical protein